MNTVIQIGIDVHKDSYSLCSYSFETRQAFGQSRIASNNQMVVKYVRKLWKRFQQPFPHLLQASTGAALGH